MSELADIFPNMTAAGLRSRAKSLSQCDPDVLIHLTNNKQNENFHSDALWCKITYPVLLFQGNPSLGGLIEDRDAEHAVSLLKQCTHVHLNDMAHNLHTERPHLFCQIVSDFLESLE